MVFCAANHPALKKLTSFILQKSGQPLWLFLGLWLLTALVYAPAYRGGYYEDFLGFLETYRSHAFLEFVSPPTHKMYLGVNLVQYLFIRLFGTHALPCFLLFTALHAATAVTVCRFARQLCRCWSVQLSPWHVLAGTLFWLLSPLAAEPITWKACSHYMCSVILMFAILNYFLQYLQKPGSGPVWKILLLYFVSIFFLELFFLTPVFMLIILLAAGYSAQVSRGIVLRASVRIWLPVLLVLGLYFVLAGSVHGDTYSRYDMDAAAVFHPLHIGGRLGRYFLHLFCMAYFLPNELKHPIYHFIDRPVVSALIFGLLALLTAVLFFRLRKARPAAQLSTVLFLLLMASFVIILPRWFYEDFSYQGSRYFYLSGIFAYLLLATALFRLPGRLGAGIAGVYLAASLAGTIALANNVHQASKVMNRMLDSIEPWRNKQEVFLLNLPIYYRGIGVIGAAHNSNFAYHLDLLRHKKMTGHVYDVSSYNMQEPGAGVHVQVEDSLKLKVIFNQYANWWWYEYQGAGNYENERYSVTFAADGFYYTLQFKQPLTGDESVLFQSSGNWKEVDMTKRGDQW